MSFTEWFSKIPCMKCRKATTHALVHSDASNKEVPYLKCLMCENPFPGKVHSLKIWPEYYKAAATCTKPFEVRKNDRGFKVGDVLVLNEFDPEAQRYTDRKVLRYVTYILDDPAYLQAGYVVLGVAPFDAHPDPTGRIARVVHDWVDEFPVDVDPIGMVEHALKKYHALRRAVRNFTCEEGATDVQHVETALAIMKNQSKMLNERDAKIVMLEKQMAELQRGMNA